MKSILFCLAAVTLFAWNAVLTERYLKENHPLWTQLIANGLIPLFCVAGIVGMRNTGNDVVLKTEILPLWSFAFLCGLILFLGNFCFYAAYSNGASVTTVTTVLCLLPILSTCFSLCLGGKFPPLNEILGTLIVIGGVLVFLYKPTPS